jgi:hypothetical protein
MGFNDLFNDYASQMRPVKSAIQNNNLDSAQKLVTKNTPQHSSYLLNQLEQARIADLMNSQTDALIRYENVYKNMQAHNQAAKVQLSAGLEQGNALFTNDSAITYFPPAYEMSMLLSYKALNYVYEHDLEAALVEIRRANKVQVDALQSNQSDLNKVASQAQSHYPKMQNIIRSAKNGFQNAYTFYLSALLYQADKNYDDAYIDYKKALEIMPNNHYLQRDIMHLAQKQGFSQDLEQYVQRFSEPPALSPEQGEVIVFIEQGLVPSQAEFKLRLPINTSQGDARFYSLAIPVYKDEAFISATNHININQEKRAVSPLVYLESLAAKTLEDEVPAKMSRQILRLIAKEKMREELARSGGQVGNIIANIYNLASEQADTRSWTTLPNQISIVRESLNAGEHTLQFKAFPPINFSVSKQGLTLLYITSINNYFNHHVVQL